MRYRVFGKSGVEVSEVGHGAWGIGGSMWGHAVDDASSLEALRRSLELGITFFDTALAYGDGHSERLIARALKDHKGAPPFLATKIPPKNGRWPARADTPVREVFPSDWIAACAERSLKNLGVERLDLLQFHVWTDAWMDQDGWWEAVEKLKRDGKIRLWGASLNDRQPASALRLVSSGRADSVQVVFNIFDQSAADRILPLCREKGVAVIARVPFDEGSLTGTLTENTTFPPGDFREGYFRGRLGEAVRRVSDLKFLLSENTPTIPRAALKFCLSFPAVTTVIPGMRKARHVDENASASDGLPFPPALLEKLKSHRWYQESLEK